MKKFLITLFLMVAIFLPFGGKVISTFMPDVVCPGEGPIFITPAGVSPTGPYVVMPPPATLSYLYYTVSPGSWILGLYSAALPICTTISVPPVLIPAFPIIMYGVSMPSLF